MFEEYDNETCPECGRRWKECFGGPGKIDFYCKVNHHWSINKERPKTTCGCWTATKDDACMIDLLGGYTQDRCAFTTDQMRHLERVYEFEPDSGECELIKAGNKRNLFRFIRRDGYRLVAFLSKFLEPNEDPVKLIRDLMSEAGYDVH